MVARSRHLFEYVVLLIALLAFTPASATVGFPDCSKCLPIAVHDAPGVGFDITAGYGVSSVNYYNGPTKDIVKVEAAHEYKDLIIRLSSAPRAEPSYFAWLQRWLNKKRGLPSTVEVGILSDLIVQLKDATENELGHGFHIDKIVLTHPRFPALTAEDLGDAIEHAGLNSWLHMAEAGSLAPNQLSENRAALAAHGFNLCQDFGSWMVCGDPLSNAGVPVVTAYYVSLMKSALFTSLDTYFQPFEMTREKEPYFFDSRVGLDSMSNYSSKVAYWAAVQDSLVPRNISSASPITHVLVAGEAAEMFEFQDALREALRKASHIELATVVWGDHDGAMGPIIAAPISVVSEPVSSLYVAARGAALLARWRQEAPLGCWERHEQCKEERKHKRDGKPAVPSQDKVDL